jgi:hypothetical protein
MELHNGRREKQGNRSLGYARQITAHGFHSTFRGWAAEQTKHSHNVAEIALAHAISNKVEAAHRRGDLFEKRAAGSDGGSGAVLHRRFIR